MPPLEESGVAGKWTKCPVRPNILLDEVFRGKSDLLLTMVTVTTDRLPLYINVSSLSSRDRWTNAFDLLKTECTVFTVVRIESGDSQAGLFDPRLPTAYRSAMVLVSS